MRKLLITTAIALVPVVAHANSYADGVKDWYAFKDWHTGLSGSYRDGAEYWASHRSVQHDTCIVAAAKAHADQDYTQGCQAAADRLAPIDARRNSDMTYRLGFIDGSKNQVNVTEYDGGGSPTPTPAPTPVYSPPSPPQVIVEHDTDNAPREAGELCRSAEPTMEKVFRRESKQPAAVGSVSFEYEGGRYVGRSVYICEMKASVAFGDDQNEFTAKTNSTWRVEWYPKDTTGSGMINVTDITSSPN